MMPPVPLQGMIPLFDRMLHHSFVPTGHEAATTRSGSPGRPVDRRASALPWTGASTVAGWHRLGTTMRIAAILVSLATAANGATTAPTMPPSTPPTAQSHGAPITGFVDDAARRFSIPAAWIRAVMLVESAGNPMAVSPKGAMGLMQIMPQTWADLRARYHLGADPFDPHDNILAGAAYLRELYDRFGAVGFLAAYNAGPSRYEAYLTNGRPLTEETRLYRIRLADKLPELGIDRVARASADQHNWRRSGLFAVQSANLAPVDRTPPGIGSVRASGGHQPVAISRLAPPSEGLFVAIAMASTQ